jgi:hypothetical protein
MTRYVIREEDDASDFAIAATLFSILMTIIGFIVAVFAAFLLVGIIWGVITSVKNYIVAVTYNGRSIGDTVSATWNGNVESMSSFFDKARDYNHILPALVKPFLVMSGVGVIVVGTVCMPVCMVIHAVTLLFSLPFLSPQEATAV